MASQTPSELIASSRVDAWDIETDVLVIGLGAAGASAAIEAREAGAEVNVLERASGLSGTTCAAAGMLYLGGGTRPQLANGIEDTTDAMFDYLVANTPEPDEAKIRVYCDESAAHFDWLVARGVPFTDGYWKTKHHTPPNTDCLSWSGNEKAWPVSLAAAPAPRGHKVEQEGGEAGSVLVQRLVEHAETLGVRATYDACVTNLIVDEGSAIVGQGSAIVGARFTVFGEERFARSRAVVLAAGGFSMNQDMLDDYCPRLAHEGVAVQGGPYDDGAAIRMGIAAGGQGVHMDGALITAPFYPPASLLKGIMVNETGRRFVNEDCYHARTSDAAIRQPNGTVYLITDEVNYERPEMRMQRLVDAWESIEEMERELGLPAGELQDEVARYNGFAEAGEDQDFHKHPEWLAPIGTPPFAALDCSLGKAYYVGFTLGGLDVSINGEVRTSDGDPVTGLYAAGSCASNIAQDGQGYSSGTCIGEATFFGRRVGTHAARSVG